MNTPNVRIEVARVAALAPLPPEEELTDAFLIEMETATDLLPERLTDEEARALLDVLATSDESTYFGMIFSVRHAVESAPSWPLPEVWSRSGPWISDLRHRAENAGFGHPNR